jgi:hypothetical protein
VNTRILIEMIENNLKKKNPSHSKGFSLSYSGILLILEGFLPPFATHLPSSGCR